MFGIGGHAAAGVAGELHFIDLVSADHVLLESAEFRALVFSCGIAQGMGFLRFRPACLTCI